MSHGAVCVGQTAGVRILQALFSLNAKPKCVQSVNFTGFVDSCKSEPEMTAFPLTLLCYLSLFSLPLLHSLLSSQVIVRKTST